MGQVGGTIEACTGSWSFAGASDAFFSIPTFHGCLCFTAIGGDCFVAQAGKPFKVVATY
jgi:hypothetical protein